MYEFTYHRPETLDKAVALIGDGSDTKILSGGMTLLPTMKQRLASPAHLVDMHGVHGLKGIHLEGNNVVIGAMTTHADVAHSDVVKKAIPGLAKLAGGIGDPHVRNRGTIGGSVANNDPAADYPSAVLALGATIVTNKRSIAADDFFQGMFSTALEEGEVITKISFPAGAKSAYAKFPNPASLYAMAGVFVAHKGGDVRVAVTGAGANGVYRAHDMEAALKANFAASALDAIKVDEAAMNGDIHGNAAYRAHLVKVMAKRAVAAVA